MQQRLQLTPAEFRFYTIRDLARSFEHNRRVLQLKVWWLSCAMLGTVAAVFAPTVAEILA